MHRQREATWGASQQASKEGDKVGLGGEEATCTAQLVLLDPSLPQITDVVLSVYPPACRDRLVPSQQVLNYFASAQPAWG